MENLDQETWRNQLANDKNAVLLDVRTPEEFEEGFIPGAILANIQEPQEFMNSTQELDKSKNFYVYCKSGGRSTQACQIMDQLGFSSTFNLEGGFSIWEGEVAK
ncbi:rhodanese-like domain-containing protein [Mesonia sp. HuA40]|uniref:rhodanese-like domain-containing protein n=1 Tax=Mesonia sp. HuA40 TaxID=2602761 RepID=UPI0011C857E5|nr:rhodanese-like domain-containing protein [Mesonia sp. HuA40]TXK73617.1 rhodanese-like domain-containing protein [Mesonia sp. HuA40]